MSGMRIAKAAGIALALSYGMLSAWAAQTYTNAAFGYRVGFPDGWLVAEMRGDMGAAVGVAGDIENLRVCGVAASNDGPDAQLSQNEVNQIMREPFGNDFWAETAGGAQRSSIRIVRAGVREHPSSLVAQDAVLEFVYEASPRRMSVTIMATPGTVYVMTCTASPTAFQRNESEMAGIVNSFRHKGATDNLVNVLPSNMPVPAADTVSALRAKLSRAVVGAVSNAEASFQNGVSR